MNVLNEVKSWMVFWGWTDQGGPGAIKLDADGKKIAEHGDMTWIADVEDACERVQRQQIKGEIERRESLRPHYIQQRQEPK